MTSPFSATSSKRAKTALEGLSEALFLGVQDAVNLLAVLLELRVAILHLLDHHIRELRQVRRLQPDTAPCRTARRMIRRIT